MAKFTKEMENYGELINVDGKTQYLNMLEANWNREYSKAFCMYNLKKEQLGSEFNWSFYWTRKKPVRPFKIIGQLVQDVLLVQRTDTKRYYRMPTTEVAQAFKLDLPLD